MNAIIKNGVYLDLDEVPIIRKEVRKLDNLSSGNTFSYSFKLQKTTKNLTTLGIPDISVSNKSIYNASDITLKFNNFDLVGSLRVERVNDFIECRFFSDAFDYIKLLTGDIRDTRFKDYTFSFPAIGLNADGYIHIPINNGTNRTTWNADVDVNYLPCFYVNSIIRDIFNEASIKLEGDILNDLRYKLLVVSNNSPYIDYDPDYIFNKTLFVGKDANQVVAAAPAATTITFPLETATYFDNPSWWDGTDSFNPGVTISIGFELSLLFSVAGAHTISISGSISGVVWTETIASSDSCTLTDYFTAINEDYTVTIVPGGFPPNILSGSTFKVFPVSVFDDAGSTIRFGLYEYLPRFILPAKSKGDFITEIFSLFNPIINFDPISKTLKVYLFEKIKTRPEEDWSQYVVNYDFDFEETLQSYGKKSLFKWEDPEDSYLIQYNESSELDFGAGSLNIDNDFISEEETVLELPYQPSWMQLNLAQQAYFPVFPFFPDEDVLEHRLFLASAFTVSDFSNKATIDTETTLGYGWFTKQFTGKTIDGAVANLSFENPVGYNGHSLKEDYFRLTESILNDPVKGYFRMLLPESVYVNLDFSTPKRIKTKDFNCLFFCQAVEGWESSHEECEVELIKL